LKNLSAEDALKVIMKIAPSVIKKLPRYIFLDEIQNVRNWESLVRSLLNRGFNVVLTGSSSKLLSKEIATQLRGRTFTYLILPFSFREFLKAKQIALNINLLSDAGKLLSYLENYIEWGGFPEVVMKSEKEKDFERIF